VKHKWEYEAGMTYRCTRCGEFDTVGRDPCDTDGIMEELDRIKKRNDCHGKRK
jgi:hypothetical protein